MSIELPENQIFTLAPGAQALSSAAATICERCCKLLPDLSTVTILLPYMQAASQLQQLLLSEAEKLGHQALLLPTILPLQQFASERAETSELRVLSEQERLLVLVNELRHHRTLYGSGSPWLLAENLLQLFDELTMNQVSLPDTIDEFTAQLSKAYQVSTDHLALQREARLVLTLWQAWQEHLGNEQAIDCTQHLLYQLSSSLENIPDNAILFVLGIYDISTAEQQWLLKLSKLCELQVLRPGLATANQVLPEPGLFENDSPVNDGYTAFLDACYNWQQNPLKQRIAEFKQQHHSSPAADRLHILGVSDFEQQAQAVALFIRAALADGSQRIGIVCEDRLLARRLRALLERSNIHLHDAVGWALSTTYAASVLESWLECIELDFPHQAVLELLKSPLLVASEDDELLKLIYRFEQDIVLHENIGSGLQRYKKAIEYRSRRFEHWSDSTRAALLELVQDLGETAAGMQQYPASDFKLAAALSELIKSMRQLQRTEFLQTDPAADQILQVLETLHQSASRQSITVTWSEFRNVIKRNMEAEYFQSDQSGFRQVVLLNLQQSGLQNFDALVVAAADEHHLPGDLGHLPFFNHSVRRALDLPDRNRQLRIKEKLFRALLESSQSTLLTWQKESKGEPVAASHWLTALSVFHQQAYNNDLEPIALKQWLQNSALLPSKSDDDVPANPEAQPTPGIGPVKPPTRLTVSAHQRLIDCPYRFYIYDILQLKPLDEIRETLQKSDYGNLVHRCLEAFHIGIDRFPGPFTEKLDEEHRTVAIHSLEKISQYVFRKDVEDNFQHRAWLQRWLEFMPFYIDWQIEHGNNWQIIAGEKRSDFDLESQLNIRGRIDRVERSGKRINLIDYKTGNTPGNDEIESGEEVQLVSYSFLLEHVSSVQYLGIDGRYGVNDKSIVSDDELRELQQSIKERLINLMQRIRDNEPMPAHGDEKTCSFCDAAGICRRAVWK